MSEPATENPRVNRSLDDAMMDHIDHALGRPTFPLRETYRNIFALEYGAEVTRAFERSDLWERAPSYGGMIFFRVTDAGRRALAEYLGVTNEWQPFAVTFKGHTRVIAAATASKARYRHYLSIHEVLPDLSFKEFSRDARVRRVA